MKLKLNKRQMALLNHGRAKYPGGKEIGFRLIGQSNYFYCYDSEGKKHVIKESPPMVNTHIEVGRKGEVAITINCPNCKSLLSLDTSEMNLSEESIYNKYCSYCDKKVRYTAHLSVNVIPTLNSY